MGKAAKDLHKALAKLPSASVFLDRLIAAAKTEAQDAIDSAVLAMGDAALIARAEANMVDAQNLLNQDKPAKAIAAYRLAWQNAGKAEK